MTSGLRKTAWMLTMVPLLALALAGCGGGDGGAENAAPNPGPSLQTEAAVPEETATSVARYDINSLMVCGVVEEVLADLAPSEAEPKEFRSALRKSLNAAFRSSTTPDAKIADVKVDRILNSGCPGNRARALIFAQIDEFSELG